MQEDAIHILFSTPMQQFSHKAETIYICMFVCDWMNDFEM